MNRGWYAREVRGVGVVGDLVAVLAYVALVNFAIAIGTVGGALRLLAVAPLLFVLPGYSLLSLVFPRGIDPIESRSQPLSGLGLRRQGIAWRERILLSFGTSVALLPLFGFVIAAIGTGFGTALAIGVPSAFVVVFLLLGAGRRLLLRADRPYQFPVESWLAELDAAIFDANDPRDAVINAVLVVVIAGALVGMSAAVAAPPSAQTYTDLSLLTTTQSGDYVESGYPSSVVAGQSEPLVAAVTNHEERQMSYTIVVEIQRLSTGSESATVLERQEVAREQTTVTPGETWYWNHTISTQMLGDDLRLTYLLYRGEPPTSPSANSAYRTTYLWISVEQPGQAGA